MDFKPGIYPDMPEDQYHADTTTLSASGAKTLLGRRPPSSDSDALMFGRLVHTVILEPDKLNTFAVLDPDEIGVKANGDKADNPTATKAWKDAVFAAKRDGHLNDFFDDALGNRHFAHLSHAF